MSTQTRKVETGDIKELSKLFDAYRIFYKKETNLREAEKFLSERIQNRESQIFVAENNKKLVGFVQLYPIFSSTRMKRLWLLNDLFVDKAYRGQGVSVLLIDSVKQLCEQTSACGLILETEKTNIVGNTLYPKTGFVLDTEHHFYSWELITKSTCR